MSIYITMYLVWKKHALEKGECSNFNLTAKRILERHGIQTSSLFVCIPEFEANFLFLWHLYGLIFKLETIRVS